MIGPSRSLPLARLAPRAACSRAHDQRQLEHSLCRQLHADVPLDLHKPAARPCLRELRRRGSPPARPAAPPRLPRRPAASANLRAQLAPEGASRAGICAALARERTPPRSCSQDGPRCLPHTLSPLHFSSLSRRARAAWRDALSASPSPARNVLTLSSMPSRSTLRLLVLSALCAVALAGDTTTNETVRRAFVTQHRPPVQLADALPLLLPLPSPRRSEGLSPASFLSRHPQSSQHACTSCRRAACGFRSTAQAGLGSSSSFRSA